MDTKSEMHEDLAVMAGRCGDVSPHPKQHETTGYKVRTFENGKPGLTMDEIRAMMKRVGMIDSIEENG